MADGERLTGGCLCGAVRFDLRGPFRDVLTCHCVECRRWTGHYWAATSVRKESLTFTEERGLRWIDSPNSDSDARRGFCGECGTSLFWEAPHLETVSIAAGSLDEPTGLRPMGHIYLVQQGDYYDLPDDGLPRWERLTAGRRQTPS